MKSIEFSRLNPKKEGKDILAHYENILLDPLAKNLIKQVQWWHLNAISLTKNELYPLAIIGKGAPILLLHGFDSSFLEFRRLVPLLSKRYKLIIPDLYGFGFCPRPENGIYSEETILSQLNEIIKKINSDSLGIIGASMGGALATKLARENPKTINRLLLLSPAGLTGKKVSVPKPFDKLGAWFLKQKPIRKALCKQAFADPSSSVGPAEEEIASLHLNVEGWASSLAAFARSGGVANCGLPLPSQEMDVIWGNEDRILRGEVKESSMKLLEGKAQLISNCGHLPHLDQPKFVANCWLKDN
tara:strand:- start:135 stop:1037 length:903 start_codon:yes stop_codon:yes gene_type:complete